MATRYEWLVDAVAVVGDACIEWPFANDHGYGRLGYKGKVVLAPHVALILDGREPPVHPMVTRHLCNNPPCVNPRHLVVGTYVENGRDSVVAGTSNRGSRNARAKLTEEQVSDILRRYRKGSRHHPGNAVALAAEFGVSIKHLRRIVNGESWSWKVEERVGA